MGAVAIIPVKRLYAAKQRLLETLAASERAALAKAMLTDVLAALDRVKLIERVIVVTAEGTAGRIALSRGAATLVEILWQRADRGYSHAASAGIARAKVLGAACAAILPGDCPLLDASELEGGLKRMHRGRVAVIPDRVWAGTNGLLMSPPDAIAPGFGPGSRQRHAERAERAGYEVALESLPSLALDVDTPNDLTRLAELLKSHPQLAPATARTLGLLERNAEMSA